MPPPSCAQFGQWTSRTRWQLWPLNLLVKRAPLHFVPLAKWSLLWPRQAPMNRCASEQSLHRTPMKQAPRTRAVPSEVLQVCV